MSQQQPVIDLSPASLVELVVSRLRGEILGGDLEPGERLVEEQVTRRFGISRAPLREAMRLLAQQGLVEHLPRRGARVATLSDQDADELFEIRDVLERFAMQRALPLTDADLGPMREELAAMRRAAVKGDQLELADAHRRFHIALVATAGHRQLIEAYEPILLKLQMHMALNLRREKERAAPLDGVRRHAVLLDAVATNDLETVLAALSAHGTHAYLR
ncbi:GntR family transcriptional regulator [Spongisporangium articulatum]|uniref:GntR family transcriptional regulator n=1 Tax=Spongisporangium articulatum TaxID=3362603 RepID=A0ABW8AGU8_9ACTN